MTSTITLITGDGSVRVYGDNLVLDLREGSVDALRDTPTNSPERADEILGGVAGACSGIKCGENRTGTESETSGDSVERHATNPVANVGKEANGAIAAASYDPASRDLDGADRQQPVMSGFSGEDDGRNVEASGGAASVITNSETPAGPLPTPRQADSAGEAVPPTSPAPLSTGATVAKTGRDRMPASAPVANSAKKLRPHCRRPELCGSGTRDHCHACKLAMGESEVAA